MEFGEMPLELRREMLSARLKARIESTPNHPMKEGLKNCWQFEFCKNTASKEPFGQRTLNSFEFLDPFHVELCVKPPNVPFWMWKPPCVSTQLKECVSKTDNTAFQKQASLEVMYNKWQNYLHVYTDGSKSLEGKVASSFYVPEYKCVQSKRMQNQTSVYRAELAAITLALYWIDQLPPLQTGVVIFSDSLSALEAIRSQREESFVTEILSFCTNLYFKGILVSLEWIPGHCGLSGNEVADKAAKKALQNVSIQVNNKLNKYEFNKKLKRCYMTKWQIKWEETNSPLKYVQRNVSQTYLCTLNDRRAETILHRLRMGNLGLNDNLFHINQHVSGMCEYCNVPETVDHFLMFCPRYIIPRAMMLVETKIHENSIQSLLISTNPVYQKALVLYVKRSQRFF